jgi:hypothetical protein
MSEYEKLKQTLRAGVPTSDPTISRSDPVFEALVRLLEGQERILSEMATSGRRLDRLERATVRDRGLLPFEMQLEWTKTGVYPTKDVKIDSEDLGKTPVTFQPLNPETAVEIIRKCQKVIADWASPEKLTTQAQILVALLDILESPQALEVANGK